MKKNKAFKIHSVKFNFLMNIILTMSGFIFPLITFPYVSRVLGPAPNGKIAFATAVINYFSLFAAMGIPSYGVRKVAEVRDNSKELNRVVNELLIINTIFTLISYIGLIILIILVPQFRENSLLIEITSISIIFTTFGVDWFYQGIEQYEYITVRNIAFKIVAIILMFIFIHNPDDYILYAGITVFANVGSNILNIINLRKYINLKIERNYKFFYHLKPIFLLFLYTATTTIFTNLDQVMLGFMTNNVEVGYYSASVKIKNILTSVITSLGAVALPRITYYLSKNAQGEFKSLIIKSFNFIFLISIPIAIYFTIEAKPIILFIAGAEYGRAAIMLQFIMPSIIFIGLSSVTAWQLLIPLKMEIWTVIAAIIGAAVNLVLNIVLIPKMGGVGTAIATDFAEFSVLITQCFAIRKRLSGMIDFTELIKSIISSLISLIILIFSFNFINIKSNFMICMLSAIIFFCIYFVTLLIFREKLISQYLKEIITRNK